MSSPGSGAVRFARTGVLATMMVALAVASHVAAGGHQPEAWSFLPAAILAIVAAHIATRLRTGFGTIFALLAAAQTGFHAIADWCPPWCIRGAHEMAEHSAGPSMVTAHLFAAFVTAGIVAYGDHLIWVLWRWLTRHLRLTAPHLLVVESYCAPTFFARLVPPARPSRGALSRRGPPLIPTFSS